MNTIEDLIYLIETNNYGDMTLGELIKIATYLVNHLQTNHSMPGDTYFQIIGILDWHRRYNHLTERQIYWLCQSVVEHIGQRDFANETD